MEFLKQTFRPAFDSKPTELLIKRRKGMIFTSAFLSIILIALVVAKLVSGFDAGLWIYLFCAGFAALGFINYQVVGEIIKERENASVKDEG